MGQDVVDIEDGIGVILADDDLDRGAVRLDDDAVQGERSGDPLILLDAAVVVGLEEAHAAILVEGSLLEVEAGGVDVGGRDADALVDVLGADGEEEEVLAAVVVVAAVAGLQGVAEAVGGKAGVFGHLDRDGDALALGLAGVEVLHVGAGEGHRVSDDGGGGFVDGLLGVEELFAQGFGCFAHGGGLLFLW